MNIQELIRQLEKLPPTARVVVDGYETGFDEATHVIQIPVDARINHN